MELQEIPVQKANALAKAEIDSLAMLTSALREAGQMPPASLYFANPEGMALAFATAAEVRQRSGRRALERDRPGLGPRSLLLPAVTLTKSVSFLST